MLDKQSRPEVPLGLGYALAMNNKALEKFAQMSSEHRRQVVEQSRNMVTKQEMRQFVDSISREEL